MLYDCSMHSQYVCGRTVILYGTQISRHSLLCNNAMGGIECILSGNLCYYNTVPVVLRALHYPAGGIIINGKSIISPVYECYQECPPEVLLYSIPY